MKNINNRPLLRSLKKINGGVDFTSNDYLGLARSADLHREIQVRYNALVARRNGSTGSRLLSGNSELIESIEHELAKIFDRETTLVFDSGYMANLAVLSTIPQRGDTILMDERAHASLKDGARLSHATKWNFRHNDVNDLERKLRVATGERWIVIESIYSMDGDEAPLPDILNIADHYNARVILDEAHTTGIYGTKGSGWSHAMGLHRRVAITVFTFGKAMGVHGAAVACTNDTRDLLINFSRPFIYTTAPSDHAIVSIQTSFDFLKNVRSRVADLQKNIEVFKSKAAQIRGWNRSNTQIQAIIVPGEETVRQAADKLQHAGYDVRAILPPTIDAGAERLRVSLHAFNTQNEIEGLIKTLTEVL